MTSEQDVVCEFWKRFDSGDLDGCDSLLSHDAVVLLNGQELDGAGFRAAGDMLRSAFPDMRTTSLTMDQEGDTVSSRCVFVATHTGDFAGMPASGKILTTTSTILDVVRNGRIVRREYLSSDMEWSD